MVKKYIDFNTQKRANAKNSFEKDFFKLMNNSIFGKTVKNIRKPSNVKLVTEDGKLIKLASKPTYESYKIFNEDLVGVNVKQPTIILNRSSFVGMCVLDLSNVFCSIRFQWFSFVNSYGRYSGCVNTRGYET